MSSGALGGMMSRVGRWAIGLSVLFVASGCGLTLDLDPPDPDGAVGGMDAGRPSLEAGMVDAAPDGPTDCLCDECMRCDRSGGCVPVMDGQPCAAGTCYGGACCDGCWDGVACQAGEVSAVCGYAGTACLDCGGRQCLEGVCELSSATSIGLGQRHSCVTRRGHLWCWGSNDRGQLGLGTQPAEPTQVPNPTGYAWRMVSAGWEHTCALDVAGQLFCFGEGGAGRLGLGDENDRAEPTLVRGRWLSVSCGREHTCAIQVDGALRCWGRSNDGRLGTGRNEIATVPTPVSGDYRWRAVAAGSRHTCGISEMGGIYCWGSDDRGQLDGQSATGSELVPFAIDFSSFGRATFDLVAAGAEHNCAVYAQELVCWGANSSRQVSPSCTEDPCYVASWTPLPATAWIAITAGAKHTCGITASQELFCWGHNDLGQLGAEDPMTVGPVRVSTAVGGVVGWTDVGAGVDHTCAFQGALLYCWGDNGASQVRADGVPFHDAPAQVPLVERF